MLTAYVGERLVPPGRKGEKGRCPACGRPVWGKRARRGLVAWAHDEAGCAGAQDGWAEKMAALLEEHCEREQRRFSIIIESWLAPTAGLKEWIEDQMDTVLLVVDARYADLRTGDYWRNADPPSHIAAPAYHPSTQLFLRHAPTVLVQHTGCFLVQRETDGEERAPRGGGLVAIDCLFARGTRFSSVRGAVVQAWSDSWSS